MRLHRITTQNFRNLAPGEHSFHPTVNILVGRNGQGKTNLLEAIYFLATTKSFRTPRTASMLRFDAPNVFVAGALQRFGVEKSVSVGLDVAESKRRVLLINGERVTLSAYLNASIVLAYSAARLEIVRGAPEEKRRFLDRGIASVDPSYLDKLTRYTRVLKQRNALLQAIALGKASQSSLDPWDDEFLHSAAAITAARSAYAEQLALAFATIVDEHHYHVRGVEIAYRPNRAEELRRSRPAEIRARVSLSGPQRDNVEFLVSGRAAPEVLSGGEMKMIVLFLKFAKLELFRRRFDESAIFLLDDVDAELDLDILQELLSRLPTSTQVFATSAKESFLRALQAGPHRRLMLENGRVTSAQDFD